MDLRASAEGSGRGKLAIRNAPRRTARHGTADVSVVVGTPTLNPDSENRGYRSRRRPHGPSNRQERGRLVAPIRHPDKKLRVANPRRTIKPTPLPSHAASEILPFLLPARAVLRTYPRPMRGTPNAWCRLERIAAIPPQSLSESSASERGNTRWPSRKVTR